MGYFERAISIEWVFLTEKPSIVQSVVCKNVVFGATPFSDTQKRERIAGNKSDLFKAVYLGVILKCSPKVVVLGNSLPNLAMTYTVKSDGLECPPSFSTSTKRTNWMNTRSIFAVKLTGSVRRTSVVFCYSSIYFDQMIFLNEIQSQTETQKTI